MAKLPRVTAKVFASNAEEGDIGQFGSALTGSKVQTGDISQIQALPAYETGWRAAVVSDRNYPTLQEMNGLQKTFSQQIAYNLQEGIAEYDANTTYYLGSIVKALNSENQPVLYYSTIDENLGNALDSENWAILSIGGAGGSSAAGLNLFDTVIKDHVLTFEESQGLALQGTYVYKTAVAGSRYGYPDFYAKCVEEKNAGTATEVTLGENTLTMYVNANGHTYYDIADIDAINSWFDTYGTAWYYGIDEANERVFLPRQKLYDITDSIPVKGNGLTLGLTNGTNNVGLYTDYDGGSRKYTVAATNPYGKNYGTGNNTSTIINNGLSLGVTTDSTKSGIIADISGSETTFKHLYIVVGNTEVTSSVTDVTEITTSENDTIPLFTGMYFDFTPNNASWLKAGTQQNSGGIYTTAYNTLVNCLTDNPYNLKVVETSNMTAGVDYSEYWKVDQTAMTFTTPTSISQKALTGGIAGNGNALFLRDVTQGVNSGNLGFTQTSNIDRLAIHNPSAAYNNLDGVGIATDVDNSGIIAEQATSQLYFKVANAVQNLELLDAGQVLETLSSKTDMAQAAHAAMPGKSVDITLGASGSYYTAPADGYFAFSTGQSPANGFVYMSNTRGLAFQCSSTGTGACNGFIPIKQGEQCFINWYLVTLTSFKFFYAEGAQ